eukprot:10200553-Prorocentrum_lima.AAC.1
MTRRWKSCSRAEAFSMRAAVLMIAWTPVLNISSATSSSSTGSETLPRSLSEMIVGRSTGMGVGLTAAENRLDVCV